MTAGAVKVGGTPIVLLEEVLQDTMILNQGPQSVLVGMKNDLTEFSISIGRHQMVVARAGSPAVYAVAPLPGEKSRLFYTTLDVDLEGNGMLYGRKAGAWSQVVP